MVQGLTVCVHTVGGGGFSLTVVVTVILGWFLLGSTGVQHSDPEKPHEGSGLPPALVSVLALQGLRKVLWDHQYAIGSLCMWSPWISLPEALWPLR